MGQVSNKRIVLLIILMGLTGIAVHFKPESNIGHRETKLASVMASVKGWKFLGHSQMPQPIVDALYLDDYINFSFMDSEDRISLYIGYYYSAKKIGAAHDPLVCFPGQGWAISDKKNGQITLRSGYKVSYAMMTGQLGQDRELITYWFQSYDQTNDNTFSQKVSLFFKKLMDKGEENAFVRITIPIGTQPISHYHDKTFNFINAFYPIFLEYILSE